MPRAGAGQGSLLRTILMAGHSMTHGLQFMFPYSLFSLGNAFPISFIFLRRNSSYFERSFWLGEGVDLGPCW